MRFQQCPKCGSSNRASDKKCYSCSEALVVDPPEVARVTDGEGGSAKRLDFLDPTQEDTVAHRSAGKTGLAVLMSMVLGGLLGLAIELTNLEMPFFLEEILLGVICSLGVAFALGKIQEMPDGLLFPRLGPAAAYGALIGLCLFGIWYTFDPSVGFIAIGAIAGVCCGLPVAVSFGLMGGQSRPLGLLEFGNVLLSLAMGAGFGIFVAMDSGDFYLVPGFAGILALIPTLLGGRINLKEILEHLEWMGH